MANATCPGCGGQVPPSQGYKPRKWCSQRCRAWSVAHPGELRPTGRTCAACGVDIGDLSQKATVCSKRCYDVARGVVRAGPLPDRECVICGKSFTPRDDRAKYCSHRCRGKRPRKTSPEAAERRIQAERQRQRTRFPERTCPVCGKVYRPTNRPGRQKTCSRACTAELRREVWPSSRIYVRECTWCTVLFVARRSKQRTCCPEHGKKLSWAESNQARHVTGHLCSCGAAIPATRHRCDACLKQTRRNQKRREKARKRESVISEPYTLAEIAERDRYRCGLCRKRVTMTKSVPHPKAPTIDHIIPWSVSKDDSRANVQLAHFSCNWMKRDGGGGEQLLLIG